MVKLLKINQSSTVDGKIRVLVDLFADTKNDEISVDTIEGLSSLNELVAGSTILTAKGEIALLDSTNKWNWI
jgi:hypothetical protein